MPFPRRGVASLPVALAILVAPPPAAAAPARHVVLAWSQDDPTCIGAAELTSMVERTLARPVFHADAPPFATVTGAVGRVAPDRFEARIALLATDGGVLAKRTLTTSGECGRLDESIAVVVTLMIDGLEEVPTPLQIPAAPSRPPAPQAAPPPAPQAAPLALALGLGGGLSSLLPGVVPSFDARGEAAFAVSTAAFVSVALTLRIHAPSSALVAGLGGRFSATTGELAACPAWAHGRLRLAGPFWARAEAGAWFPLLRERWGYVDGRGVFEQVFRPAPVVPAATLTLELHAGS